MIFSSIVNYIQAVTLAHKLRNMEPPCMSAHALKLTLQGIKRGSTPNPNPRAPVTIDIVMRMYKCLNFNVKLRICNISLY